MEPPVPRLTCATRSSRSCARSAPCHPRRWPRTSAANTSPAGWRVTSCLLPRRAGGPAGLGGGDVRGAEAGDRLLALGRRPLLPAHRQGAAHARDGGGGAVQEPAAGLFERVGAPQVEPNILAVRIQPDEGILLRFGAKVPGPGMQIRSVNMDFRYGYSFAVDSPDAYETLLLDAMVGDPACSPATTRWSGVGDPGADPERLAAGAGARCTSTAPDPGVRRRPMNSWSAAADPGDAMSETNGQAAEAERELEVHRHLMRFGEPSRGWRRSGRCATPASAGRPPWPAVDDGRRRRPARHREGLPASRIILNLIVTVPDEPSAAVVETMMGLGFRHPSRHRAGRQRGTGPTVDAR